MAGNIRSKNRGKEASGFINLKYIAKLAKVSPAKVFHVINEKPGVADETRERVLESVDWVGYTPNLLLLSLLRLSLFKQHSMSLRGKGIRSLSLKRKSF
jgi:hypothetical protein